MTAPVDEDSARVLRSACNRFHAPHEVMRMVRPIRPVWVALGAAVALYFGAFSTIALHGSGQTAAGQAPTVAQAAPFVGNWVMTVATGSNQSTSLVSVKSDGGKVT